MPVFYFHGFPGSRLEAALLDEAGRSLGVRVIGVDRPGYGCSDPSHGRRFADWARDVASLADALNISRFAIIGVSGGGPYALSTAVHLAHRVRTVAIVCGLGPLSAGSGRAAMAPVRRFACRLLRLAPWLIPLLSGAMGRRLARDPEGVFRYLLARVPAPDRKTLAKPENRALLQASFTEAIRCGSAGIASDALLYLSEWDFTPRATRVPVTLWHGELDETVPASMSRELAEALPRAQLKLFPEEGHYSLPFRYHREILESALTT